MADNFFAQQGQQIIRDGIRRDPFDNELKSDPFRNFFGGLLGGGTDEDAKDAYKSGQASRESEQAWKDAAGHQGTLSARGLSKKSSAAAIKSATLEARTAFRDNTPAARATIASIKTGEKKLDLMSDRLEQARQQANQQFELANQRQSDANDIAKLTLQQRSDFRTMDQADKKSDRAMQLEIEQMRGAREDKRLEQQHKMYYDDKRQAGIQSLVAGLAALGAAFAV